MDIKDIKDIKQVVLVNDKCDLVAIYDMNNITDVYEAISQVSNVMYDAFRRLALDDRCKGCKHSCNEDCGHPEMTDEDYELGTDIDHKEWHDNMEG